MTVFATIGVLILLTANLATCRKNSGEDRAIGALTASDYSTRFTEDSQKLLAGLGLTDKRLVKDNSVSPTTETIEWTQASRCWWGCEEEYRLVDYYIDGDTSGNVYKVFIAKDITPPGAFRTSGYNKELHFGFLTFGTDDGAVFFVIHPNSWGPYQHRFKTNSFTAFVKGGLSSVASAVAGAAAGAATGAAIGSIVPGLGTVVGAVVGYGASSLTDDYFGDYLRYIG